MLLTRSRRTLAALAVAATLFTGFFERAFALITGWPQGLFSFWEANGSSLDPNGGPTTNDDRGSSLDPNG